MSPALSLRTIEILKASLPAVEAHRPAITSGMAASLAAADPEEGAKRATGVAASLVGMLIEQVRSLTEAGEWHDIEAIRREHARTDIGRFHYTRFGDAIAAVMVDSAGAVLPKRVGGAWVDAFWAIIRQVNEVREAVIRFERIGDHYHREPPMMTSRA